MLKLHRYDPRTRRDRIERENGAWDELYEPLTTAYMQWDLHGAPEDELEDEDEVMKHPQILTVKMKCKFFLYSLNYVT